MLPRSFTLYPSDGARPDSGTGACSQIGVLLEPQPAKLGLLDVNIDSVESSFKDHIPTAKPEAGPVTEHCCVLLCFKGWWDPRTGGEVERIQCKNTQGQVYPIYNVFHVYPSRLPHWCGMVPLYYIIDLTVLTNLIALFDIIETSEVLFTGSSDVQSHPAVKCSLSCVFLEVGKKGVTLSWNSHGGCQSTWGATASW